MASLSTSPSFDDAAVAVRRVLVEADVRHDGESRDARASGRAPSPAARPPRSRPPLPSSSLRSGMPKRITAPTPTACSRCASATASSGERRATPGSEPIGSRTAAALADEERCDELLRRQARLAHEAAQGRGAAQTTQTELGKGRHVRSRLLCPRAACKSREQSGARRRSRAVAAISIRDTPRPARARGWTGPRATAGVPRSSARPAARSRALEQPPGGRRRSRRRRRRAARGCRARASDPAAAATLRYTTQPRRRRAPRRRERPGRDAATASSPHGRRTRTRSRRSGQRVEHRLTPTRPRSVAARSPARAGPPRSPRRRRRSATPRDARRSASPSRSPRVPRRTAMRLVKTARSGGPGPASTPGSDRLDRVADPLDDFDAAWTPPEARNGRSPERTTRTRGGISPRRRAISSAAPRAEEFPGERRGRRPPHPPRAPRPAIRAGPRDRRARRPRRRSSRDPAVARARPATGRAASRLERREKRALGEGLGVRGGVVEGRRTAAVRSPSRRVTMRERALRRPPAAARPRRRSRRSPRSARDARGRRGRGRSRRSGPRADVGSACPRCRAPRDDLEVGPRRRAAGPDGAGSTCRRARRAEAPRSRRRGSATSTSRGSSRSGPPASTSPPAAPTGRP